MGEQLVEIDVVTELIARIRGTFPDASIVLRLHPEQRKWVELTVNGTAIGIMLSPQHIGVKHGHETGLLEAIFSGHKQLSNTMIFLRGLLWVT